MIQGLYSAASSLTASERQQEVISHNLAHATVPGYRGRALAFSTFDPTGTDDPRIPTGGNRGTDASREYTNFLPGDYQKTDNPLDVAVRGDGFFALQGPNGTVYTRNGSFELNAEGQIQTKSGLLVNATGGPITIPPTTSRIGIGQDGSVTADGAQVGQLNVVSFQDPSQLVRVGPTLFESPAGGDQPGQSQVLQGYREGSNVGVIQEMVNLIAGSRYYEAASKALKAISESLQQRTSPQQG